MTLIERWKELDDAEIIEKHKAERQGILLLPLFNGKGVQGRLYPSHTIRIDKFEEAVLVFLRKMVEVAT